MTEDIVVFESVNNWRDWSLVNVNDWRYCSLWKCKIKDIVVLESVKAKETVVFWNIKQRMLSPMKKTKDAESYESCNSILAIGI